MKTIGLIGGMSWESTLEYYRRLNRAAAARLGGLHSARLVLSSVDFAEIEALQHAGDWGRAAARMADEARRLEGAGAELVLLCTNTMHRVADAIEAAITVPFLHIADSAGEAIRAAGLTRVGLLGTRFTMEQPFYRQRLAERHGIDVQVPGADARTEVHRAIYDELCHGRFEPATRQRFRTIVAELVADGAEGIVLGCTEIPLLLSSDDADVPLFDTTALHVDAAARRAFD